MRIEEDRGTLRRDNGEVIPDWQPLLSTPDKCCWAEIEDISGREYWNTVQVASDVTTKITLRRFEGIKEPTPDMRGVITRRDGEETYQFTSVRRLDAAGRDLEIMAVRQVHNVRA